MLSKRLQKLNQAMVYLYGVFKYHLSNSTNACMHFIVSFIMPTL